MSTSGRLHRLVLAAFAGGLCFLLLGPALMRLLPTAGARILPLAMSPMVIAAWLVCFLYFLGNLLFDSGLRHSLLSPLSGLRDQGEVGTSAAGRAAKEVYLITVVGFVAAGLWGMSTVNLLVIHKPGASFAEIQKVVPFIGLALPLDWPQTVHKAWVRRNAQDPVEYRDVADRNILAYGSLADGRKYSLFLTPPIHPRLSRLMFLCSLLQIGLFKLFAQLAEKGRHLP